MAGELNALDAPASRNREVEDLFVNKADRDQRHQIDILLETIEEYLGINRVLTDLIDIDAADETVDAKAEVLDRQVEHHVEEE